MTVYSMTFSTGAAPPNGLGLPRNEVLWMLMMAVIGFGVVACRRPAGGRFWSSQEHDYHHHDDYFVRPVRL